MIRTHHISLYKAEISYSTSLFETTDYPRSTQILFKVEPET